MAAYVKNRLGTNTAIWTTPDDTRNIYPDPGKHVQIANRNAMYAQMFAYYSNTAFEDFAGWARYRLKHNIYKYTRPIFNPVTRVVDFYAEHIYPGALIGSARAAIPFTPDTPEEIKRGAEQLWQWSNWQVNNSIMVQHGSLTGNVAVDVVDDVERGKIRFNVYYPSMVRDLVLDAYGNVRAIVFEFTTSDPLIDGGRPFLYAKEVQQDFIAEYKNGEPHDFGNGAIRENPYGFASVVWAKHIDIGEDFGVPAIRSAIGKIDELNSMVSHTVDHIHKQIESPRILWTDTTITPLFGQEGDYIDFDSRNQQLLLKGRAGGTTDTLVGTLDPQTIVPIVEKILAEVERDYPEITMYEKLRDQNIVTAPGAARLMGDVERKMSRPAANYDRANEKLIQMGLAIGGWRANRGDWGFALSPQQQKFLDFDLDSYNKGELDLTIVARELTPQTSREEADELAVRANAVAALGDNIPLEEVYRILGKREDEIPALVAATKRQQEEKAAREIEKAKALKPPAPVAAPAKPAAK
jgi:hypothetical protein